MKRTITLLFALLIAFAASAQDVMPYSVPANEAKHSEAVAGRNAIVKSSQTHMKFMGIPLNGTINAFQQKLAAKGVQPNKALNEILPVGTRVFTGTFCGYEAEIGVYYNTKTKTVYRAKAFFTGEDKEQMQRRYNEFLDLLNNKYPDAEVTEGENDGFDACGWRIWGEDSAVGWIELFISEDNSFYPTQYTLHIDYTDAINYFANNASKSEDL